MIPDACPECDPLDGLPSLPDGNGVHCCPAGHAWITRRDEHGWPVERRAA